MIGSIESQELSVDVFLIGNEKLFVCMSIPDSTHQFPWPLSLLIPPYFALFSLKSGERKTLRERWWKQINSIIFWNVFLPKSSEVNY